MASQRKMSFLYWHLSIQNPRSPYHYLLEEYENLYSQYLQRLDTPVNSAIYSKTLVDFIYRLLDYTDATEFNYAMFSVINTLRR